MTHPLDLMYEHLPELQKELSAAYEEAAIARAEANDLEVLIAAIERAHARDLEPPVPGEEAT